MRNEELGINVVGPLGRVYVVWGQCRERCQRLMGFAVSEGRWVRCGKIGNGMVWGVNALKMII